MRYLRLVMLMLITATASAQNSRDKILKTDVMPFFTTDAFHNADAYQKTKASVEKLGKDYGYEVEWQRKLLEASFIHKDIAYFKNQLEKLVRDHGFQVIYMKGDETYFESVMTGELSAWFRKMFVENHPKWLAENFERQRDLKRLNDLDAKDQLINKFASKLYFSADMDSMQKRKIQDELNAVNFEHAAEIASVSKKIGHFPGNKNFAVLQNGFGNVLVHNFQQPDNIDRTWKLLFPYLKSAYKNYDLSHSVFQNYDFYSYVNFGYQHFNSYTIDQIPENFRKSNSQIPLKDSKFYTDVKAEFKW